MVENCVEKGRVPTCGQVEDADEHVSALHHVDGHMGEAAAVLQEGGPCGHWLHHLCIRMNF